VIGWGDADCQGYRNISNSLKEEKIDLNNQRMKIAHKGGPQPCQLSPVDIGTIVQYAQQLQVLIWRDLQRSEADFGVLCKPSVSVQPTSKEKASSRSPNKPSHEVPPPNLCFNVRY